MTDVFIILLLSIAGSVFGLVGGVLFLFQKKWSHLLSSYSVSFAAGVLLTVSLLGLMPESLHMMGENAFLIVLISFLGSYLFENYFVELHHHNDCDHKSHIHSSIPLVIIGDSIHNFIDGVAIAATYLISPGLGLITTASTFLHEVPHEIGDFGILLKAGWQKKNIIIANLLSSLTTIIGALLVFWIQPSEYIIGILMAISAGIFLYLGASDFLPHIHHHQNSKRASLLALIIGVIIMLTTISLIPHSHEEHDTEHDHHSDELTLITN